MRGADRQGRDPSVPVLVGRDVQYPDRPAFADLGTTLERARLEVAENVQLPGPAGAQRNGRSGRSRSQRQGRPRVGGANRREKADRLVRTSSGDDDSIDSREQPDTILGRRMRERNRSRPACGLQQGAATGEPIHAGGVVEDEDQVRRAVTSGIAGPDQRVCSGHRHQRDDRHAGGDQQPVADPHGAGTLALRRLQVSQGREGNASVGLAPNEVKKQRDDGQARQSQGRREEETHPSRARF